ncbi:CARDB domain-containing protein [Actinoplanes sp. NPDC026619]|uniref:CARDB domain-containing protein n=1 Tax=Actinoplanes sp. NPDC026619 TaxID=3155798 RepID=UPI0033EB2966
MRLLPPLLMTLVALAVPATPAWAAAPQVAIAAPQVVTALEGHTQAVTATVTNTGTSTAKDLVVSFSGVSAGLRLRADSDVPDLAPGESRKYQFSVTPAAATTAAGVASSFKITVGTDTAEVTVVRAAGTELAVAGLDEVSVDHGNYANVGVTFRNISKGTYRHPAVVLVTEAGIAPVAGYANCEYDRTDVDFTTVTCLADQELAPGATLSTPASTNPLMLEVPEHAAGPHTYAASVAVVDLSDAVAASLATNSGPRMAMTATATAAHAGSGNVTTFGVKVGAPPAGSAAIAAPRATGIGTGWVALGGAVLIGAGALSRRRRVAARV